MGEAVTPAPTVTVDKSNNTISMDFASDALGRPESLDGIRFYVTTWDLDGLSATYRPLEQDKGQRNFSGGASDESKIWDDLPSPCRNKPLNKTPPAFSWAAINKKMQRDTSARFYSS